MFQILIGVIFVILLILICYTVMLFTKIKYINSINNKLVRILLSLIPIIIIFLIFNVVNSIVILLHLCIFISISSLIFRMIKMKDKYNLIVLIGIITTIIYLSIGAYLDYHVFETKYEVFTHKELGSNKFRIIQISDSHVGTTFDGEGFYKKIENISKIDSDLFVLTGDFVDDDTTKEDMIKSCEALSLIKSKYGVYFIYGNHDKGYFNYRNFSEADLIYELEKNNVKVLSDEVVELNNYMYLIGRNDKSYQRKSISELTDNLDKTKYIIDLNHQPNDYNNEKEANVDLVLSGHTHGGQLFPLGYIGVLFKANDMFKGMKKIDNTYFVVNTGISDWAIDFKTGTHSEYVIIDIVKE